MKRSFKHDRPYLKYLEYALSVMIWNDLLVESYFISDVIKNPVKRIVV